MSYQIVIKQGCFESQLSEIKPKLIILDSNVQLESNYPTVIFETSEEEKNFDLYFRIIEQFEQYNLNRNDTVMIVGGGVLIDVASFAASTYKRGINYVNVPTTTLSMIDSSVGSKNGLNYNNQKNLIGNITDPSCVIIDIDFLHSLDKRNYYNGLAEAVKIGYLSNPQIIEQLNEEELDIEKIIKLSVKEKLAYVKADKLDHGKRNYLNFGHTFGHAIESYTNFNQYLHGEAVSIGMVIASDYDQQLIQLLSKLNLPTQLPTNINLEQLVELMLGDKKNTSEKIKVIKRDQIVELTQVEVKAMINKQIVIDNTRFSPDIIVNKSKSYIHRLLASALATKSKISFEFNVANDLSDDVKQSINILLNVGAIITYDDGTITVDCQQVSEPQSPFSIYKSATTYRIFAPILCSMFGSVAIELDEQLASRPHDVFSQFVTGNTHHIRFDTDYYQIDGSISSQFISGYILALVAKGQNATIEITGHMTSVPYIDMTIAIINKFGTNVTRNENIITIDQSITIPSLENISCEPDYSSLAYFVVYNKLSELHNKLPLVSNCTIAIGSLQADSIIGSILGEQVVDMANCPDLLPTLVAYGLLNKRGITLTNIDRIKYKECDRTMAMITNFADLDSIKIVDNNLVVKPVNQIAGRTINTFGDHRIAMAATVIAAFSAGPFVIDDYTVVHKSFPTFFEQIRGL